MKEEILSTETIFDGRIVHLKVHTIRLPDGNLGKRELIHHSGAVAIIALDDEQRVLMVKQYRIGLGDISYEIPAGVLELGENPLAAAEREMREETGYRPLALEPMGGLYVAPGYTTEYIHLFHAIGLELAPLSQDADEFIEFVRIPLVETLAMIERAEIVEAKTVIALLRIARRLGL